MNPTDQPRSTVEIAQHFEAFDRGLRAGDVVEVRWTNSHRYFSARAEVQKLHAKSIRVRLLEAVAGVEGDLFCYEAGRPIVAPRMYAPRWSANNGVFPLPAIQGIVIDEMGARVAKPLRSDRAICELIGAASLQPHEFYVSTHPGLLVGPEYVALQDVGWAWKQLPVFEPAVPLRGSLFIVHRPLTPRGYWQSLTTNDIAAFSRLFGVDVAWGDVQKGG